MRGFHVSSQVTHLAISDLQEITVAKALIGIPGQSRSDAATYAVGYVLLISEGRTPEETACKMGEVGPMSLGNARKFARRRQAEGFLKVLSPRTEAVSVENPTTKPFPAILT